ncbi:hypothetical protein B0H14DRAFT_2584883 [Mycena olivaceomarginata]|nr:hypothetical protein B0H14DRAFT_2584883 [Mycena olivaceomarginata]
MILEKAARRRHRTEFAASEFVVEILRSEGAAPKQQLKGGEREGSQRRKRRKRADGSAMHPRKSSGNLSPAHPQRPPRTSTPPHPTPGPRPRPHHYTSRAPLRNSRDTPAGLRFMVPFFHAPGAERERDPGARKACARWGKERAREDGGEAAGSGLCTFLNVLAPALPHCPAPKHLRTSGESGRASGGVEECWPAGGVDTSGSGCEHLHASGRRDRAGGDVEEWRPGSRNSLSLKVAWSRSVEMSTPIPTPAPSSEGAAQNSSSREESEKALNTDSHSNACALGVSRQPRCDANRLKRTARRKHRTEFAASKFVVEILRSEGAAPKQQLEGGEREDSQRRKRRREQMGHLLPPLNPATTEHFRSVVAAFSSAALDHPYKAYTAGSPPSPAFVGEHNRDISSQCIYATKLRAAHALHAGIFFCFACERHLSSVTLAPQSKVTHKIASFVCWEYYQEALLPPSLPPPLSPQLRTVLLACTPRRLGALPTYRPFSVNLPPDTPSVQVHALPGRRVLPLSVNTTDSSQCILIYHIYAQLMLYALGIMFLFLRVNATFRP